MSKEKLFTSKDFDKPKDKLFTSKDFDKPKDKSFWQKYKSWIFGITALLIVAVIVLCYTFCVKEEPAEQEQTVQIAQGVETNVSSKETEDVKIDNSRETEYAHSQETKPTSVSEEVTQRQDTVHSNPKPQLTGISDNVEAEAMKVIRGDYGNIPERREKLGSKYQEIQNRVNQLKREGAF